MSMSSHLLERGISFWKSSQQEQARKIFESIIYNDRHNDTAWVWYIYSLDTNREKIAALETFLNIFPNHGVGVQALEKLKTEDARQIGIPAKLARIPEEADDIRQERLLPVRDVRPAQQSRSVSIPWVFVILGLCLLLSASTIFIGRYNSLQADYLALETREATISRNYDALNRNYQTLESEKAALVTTHNALVSQYNTLNNEHSTLWGNYNTLSAEHNNLKNTYDSLLIDYNYTVQSYSAFKEIAIAPPYIYTRERKVHLVFKKLDGSLLRWTIDSAWLEHHLRRGDELREHLDYDLTLYNEFTDETYRAVDDRDFIDTTPFTHLMADLYYASPDDYTFIKEVWNIVAQLTAYTSEIGETPRFPMETLLSGGGDCEDHAILFASMILASPVPWEVKFIYMDGEHPTQPETMNHVIVQVITADTRYLIEATSKNTMNPYNEGVYGWFYPISRNN